MRTRIGMAGQVGVVFGLVVVMGKPGLSAREAGQAAAQAAPGPAGQTVPLTMDQAVAMALEANLGLKAERLNLEVAAHSVALARSAFLPQVQSSLSRQTSRSVPSDFTQGSEDISSAGLRVSGSVSQNLKWYGSSYGLTWSGSRNTQIGGLSPFNPRLGSSLQVAFDQPLLRGFKTDAARVALTTSERNRAITDIQIQQQIVSTEASVRLAYLSLVGAIEGKKVAEQNMEIARRSLEQSRARVKVGVAPAFDIVESQAQVASNEEQLLLSEARIATSEDFLRSLILDTTRPDYWQVRLVPTDTIELTQRDIDLDQAIKTALANRLDLAVQKRSLEITDLNLQLGRNNTLPNVDFNVGYVAQGTAGTQFAFGSGFPPPIIDRTDRPFGSALGDTFGNAYPSWSVGVTVGYPIGRTAAQVSYAQSQVRKRQQELDLQQLEFQIVGQVREAVRQVQNSYLRVQAAQLFRQAAEEQLTAEQRRFEVGISTTLALQIRQRDLANARVSELGARIDYNRALIILDRVQKTQ